MAWWVVYLLGAAALAVGYVRLAQVEVNRFGLRRPPLAVVLLLGGGAAAIFFVATRQVDSTVWAFVALVGGWLPAGIVSFVLRRRSGAVRLEQEN